MADLRASSLSEYGDNWIISNIVLAYLIDKHYGRDADVVVTREEYNRICLLPTWIQVSGDDDKIIMRIEDAPEKGRPFVLYQGKQDA